jgi:hypothetical protein
MKKITLLFLLLISIMVYDAKADTSYTLDGGNGKMVFQLNANGVYNLYKKNSSGGTIKQIYPPSAVLFGLKIGSAVYRSGECCTVTAGCSCGSKYIANVGTQLTAADVSAVTSGTVKHIEKKYTGTYNSYPFTVYWRVDYNIAEDRLGFTAIIDASNIPAGTSISYAYAVDTYVNGLDAAKAITIPDIIRNGTSLNNSNSITTLTQAEVQSLNFVGCINTTASGNDMFGFHADGNRKFDRAYSALYNPAASPQQYLNKELLSTPVSLVDFKDNSFTYGQVDNGIAVVYDNIPTGEATTINTSVFIAQNVTSNANLDWTWNNSKGLTVAVGTPVDLKINAANIGTEAITGVSYTVAMPSGLPASGAVAHTGFTAGNYTGASGSTSCSVSGASIPINTTGVLTIPVSTAKYGSWTVAASQFSGLTYTVNPSGISPAVLNVTSEVNYSSGTEKTVIREEAAPYTVQLPDGVMANGNLTVNLSNSNPADFTAPASVVISNGTNSVSFNVTPKATATPGATNITTINSLSGNNSNYVNIGATNSATTIAKVPVLSPPNASTFCPGATISIDFSGTDIIPANCTWTNTNTAIGLAASGSGDISFTATNTTNNTISGIITVTPNDKGDSKQFSISIDPLLTPAVEISANPGFEVCESIASITFTATPTNGGATPSYEWKIDGVQVQTGASESYTLNNLSLYHKSKISCTLTTSVTCPTTTMVNQEKNIRVSPCVISVNPQIRGKIRE